VQRSVFLAIVLASVPPALSFADNVETVSSRVRKFMNSDCEREETCSLRSFSVRDDVYVVHLPEGSKSFGTRMFASYETRRPEDLEQYGIAQIIRGCQFSSSRNALGIVEKNLDITRPFYGATIVFRHPEWVIDGLNRDPIDWGYESRPDMRHFHYRWNSIPGSFEKATARYFGKERPTRPELYVRDLPGTSFHLPEYDSAKNISLRFRTCIYKERDVPRDVPAEQLGFAKPIQCFEWASSFVFNHETGSFESPKAIDPICL